MGRVKKTLVDYGYSRTVHYEQSNHLSVIFQWYGSVWPRVLPHCFMNMIATVFAAWCIRHGIKLSMSEYGHTFMSILVSFLIISKFNIILGKYFELRGHLSTMFQATREVVQLSCALTADEQERQEWRSKLALYSMLQLEVTVAMLYRGDNVSAWQVPQLPEEDRARVLTFLPDEDSMQHGARASFNSRQWVHQGFATPSDRNLSVPIRMAYRLRRVIAEAKLPLPITTQLILQVRTYMHGYYGIRKYLTTPLPFPLVQMARIFLFFYVYTLPFALLHIMDNIFQELALVFIVTYGFVGMECICMELHDPFEDEPNDLPVVEQAKSVYDDIYLTILDTDGVIPAMALRRKMSPKQGQTSMDAISEDDYEDAESADFEDCFGHERSETSPLLVTP